MTCELTPDEAWLLDVLARVEIVPLAPCVAPAFEKLRLKGLARCERGGIAAVKRVDDDTKEHTGS